MNQKIIIVAVVAIVFVGGIIVYGVSGSSSEQEQIPNVTNETVENVDPIADPALDSETPSDSLPITEDKSLPPLPPAAETNEKSTTPMSRPEMPEAPMMSDRKDSMEMKPKNSSAELKQKVASKTTETKTESPMKPTIENSDIFDGKKIVKSKKQWKQLLTPMQFYVLREEGTEKPYTGKYTDNKKEGDYHCAACKLKLFSSDAKYNSLTGWASFYKPFSSKNIIEKVDNHLDETRTEIICARCNSHLGHVFDDGPEPTGLRYCINSAALSFTKKK